MNGPHSSFHEIELEVQGISTHVLRGGTGAPLFLVHGVGGPNTWQKVIDPLARHFEVVVLHLPGFGRSACPQEKFSTNHYSDVINAVMERLKISRTAIAGTSYGAEISATFAFRHPDRVGKLILITSTGLGDRRWFARSDFRWWIFSFCLKHTLLRSRTLLDLSGRKSFYDLRNRPADLTDDFLTDIRQNGKRDTWLNCLRNLSTPSNKFRLGLATLEMPTLILWGGNDRAVQSNSALEFRRLIRHASLKIFSGCAHSVPLEKPAEVCDAIVEFCSRG